MEGSVIILFILDLHPD